MIQISLEHVVFYSWFDHVELPYFLPHLVERSIKHWKTRLSWKHCRQNTKFILLSSHSYLAFSYSDNTCVGTRPSSKRYRHIVTMKVIIRCSRNNGMTAAPSLSMPEGGSYCVQSIGCDTKECKTLQHVKFNIVCRFARFQVSRNGDLIGNRQTGLF